MSFFYFPIELFLSEDMFSVLFLSITQKQFLFYEVFANNFDTCGYRGKTHCILYSMCIEEPWEIRRRIRHYKLDLLTGMLYGFLGAGTEPSSSTRALSSHNLWIISLAFNFYLLYLWNLTFLSILGWLGTGCFAM